MQSNTNTIFGVLLVILGTILFFIFMGAFLTQVVGGLVSLWIISYGLTLTGNSYSSIIRSFNRGSRE